MLNFSIELSSSELEEDIDSYSTANISIKGEYGYLTSKREKPPYQDMMIFLSISDLLDGVSSFFENKRKQYKFVGVDSSFQFFLIKDGRNIVLKDAKKIVIGESSSLEIVHTIWNGVNNFMLKYGKFINENESVAEDLYRSIEKFKAQFEIIDKQASIKSSK